MKRLTTNCPDNNLDAALVGYAIVRGRYTDVGLSLGPYGVSWFLTREEAEKALEAMKDE